MTDSLLMFDALDRGSAASAESSLWEIGQWFGKSIAELYEDYKYRRNFSELHEVLLGIHSEHRMLEAFLYHLLKSGRISELIDEEDSSGRTPVAWAAEFGWSEAVTTLLKYGANPHQVRNSVKGSLPLLHLAVAGPGPSSRFVDVVRVWLVRVSTSTRKTTKDGHHYT